MFEDPTLVLITAVMVGFIMILAVGQIALVGRCYKSVPPGQALILTMTNGTKVRRNGGRIVWPIVHSAVLLDLSMQRVVVERSGANGLQCRDGVRADCRAEFLVRVNATDEDILSVVQKIGAERAARPETLEELFAGKFADALAGVAAQLEFEDLLKDRERFRDHVLESVGVDLGGYVLDDLAIASLEQTPISALDPDNLKDAQGIRQITERVERERIETTRIRLESAQTVQEMEAQAAQAMAAMNADRAEAEANARTEMEAARAEAAATVAAAEAQLEAAQESSGAKEGDKPTTLQPWRIES